MDSASAPVSEYEYIVVGSGAGGGTLAARLAEAGCRVLLLEAGGDPRQLRGGDPVYPEADRLPDDYDVPCFHGFASENEAMKWDFFVRHYADDALQRRDDKYCTRSPEGKIVDGVLYPRAGSARRLHRPQCADPGVSARRGLGRSGEIDRRSVLECGQHAHDTSRGWRIATTGFHTAGSACWGSIRPGMDGRAGSRPRRRFRRTRFLETTSLIKVILRLGGQSLRDVGTPVERVRWLFQSQADPNDWRLVKAKAVGCATSP